MKRLKFRYQAAQPQAPTDFFLMCVGTDPVSVRGVGKAREWKEGKINGRLEVKAIQAGDGIEVGDWVPIPDHNADLDR